MLSFEDLYHQFPQFRGDYTPPWGLPTLADFQRIQSERGVRYPAPFVEFQTAWARRLPAFAQGLHWANPGLEPYASLQSLIDDAQALRLTGFAPFADDNGDLIGFPAHRPSGIACAPVSRYELAVGAFAPEAESFVHWLRAQYPRPT